MFKLGQAGVMSGKYGNNNKIFFWSIGVKVRMETVHSPYVLSLMGYQALFA